MQRVDVKGRGHPFVMERNSIIMLAISLAGSTNRKNGHGRPVDTKGATEVVRKLPDQG